MSEFVTGIRAELVRSRLILHFALSSVAYFKNPFRGLKALALVRSKRRSFQGLQRVRKYVRSGGRYFFSDNIPGWPSKAFNGFIRAELMRVSVSNGARIPFSTAFFSITAKCPLRCPHCYEWENLSSDEKLTYEDLLVILRKLQDYGTFHFQLSGGEPLERLEALLPLVSLARREADVWINTSGFGLTREVAHSLKEAGLTGAEISLDHWEEKEHNHFRKNPESFGWVLKAVENCNAEGILTSLSLCATSSFVTRENLDRYIALAMSLGISIIRILDARVTAWFKGDETILTPGQTALLEEYYRGASSPDRPPAYPLITYPGYHARMTGCTGGGNRYIYIDPKGDIHPCPFCRRPSGNAVTDSLDRVVEVLKSQGCKKYGIFSGN